MYTMDERQMTSHSLQWLDYVLLSVILMASLGIGVYHSVITRVHQTQENYLMANRNMPVYPVACSIIVTSFSAITFLGKT